MPENLKAVASAAGLSQEEQKAMQDLQTTLAVHRELLIFQQKQHNKPMLLKHLRSKKRSSV